MPEFRPRKATYIKERNGQFFYRRAIPMASRAQFGGLTEWNIRLEGRTHSERVSEAHAHAHRHNQDIAVGIGGRIVSRVEESQTLDGPDLSIRVAARDGSATVSGTPRWYRGRDLQDCPQS